MDFTKKQLIREAIGKGPVALAHLNLLTALASSLATTVWALYINSFVNSPSTTGLISGFLSVVSFISYFAFIPLLRKSDKRELFAASLAIFAIFYITLYILQDIYTIVFISILVTVLNTIRVTSVGVLFKNSASDKELAEKEGLNWTFINLGWIIGPIVAGYIANKVGIRPVFLVSAAITLFALFLFYFTHFKREVLPRNQKIKVIKNFRDFFTDKNRAISYLLTSGIAAWWTIIYVYIPLYMSANGFSVQQIGYLIFGAVLPLILFEHKFSKLSYKIGFKKIFAIGFGIPAIFAISAFFTSSIYLQLSFIILSSIGLSMLEPTTEAYFLKVTKKEDIARLSGPYCTSRDLGRIILKIAPAIIIIFLPFKFVFLSIAIVMGFLSLLALKVKD